MLPIHSLDYLKFQHTTARRRLLASTAGRISETSVSTHNRPKAAAVCVADHSDKPRCFNTQPPEGGCIRSRKDNFHCSGFNTQPPEGGCYRYCSISSRRPLFQHTTARRRLHFLLFLLDCYVMFQHTTARRRLLPT